MCTISGDTGFAKMFSDSFGCDCDDSLELFSTIDAIHGIRSIISERNLEFFISTGKFQFPLLEFYTDSPYGILNRKLIDLYLADNSTTKSEVQKFKSDISKFCTGRFLDINAIFNDQPNFVISIYRLIHALTYND